MSGIGRACGSRRTSVKEEFGDNTSPCGSSVEASSRKRARTDHEDSDDGTEFDKDKACQGCSRRPGDACFYGSAGGVEWANSQHRGLWCRDCFNCWRLAFSKRATLLMFVIFLRDARNRREWFSALLAYLSLRRDNVVRVTEASLHARRELLDWVSRMVCCPMGPIEVIPLSSMTDTTNLEAHRLVTMRTTDSSIRSNNDELPQVIGYLIDSETSSVIENGVPRPAGEASSFLGFHPFKFLCTDRQDDNAILENAFSFEMPQSSTGSSADGPIVSASSVSREPETKCQKQFGTLHGWTLGHLAPYALESWEDIKETSFNTMITKFNNLKVEAAHVEKHEFVEKVEHFTFKLSQGKAFTNKFKAYKKCTKQKLQRLMALHPLAGEWVDFLKGHIVVHTSLELLRLKVEFLSCAEGRWSARYQAMLDNGLVGLLSRLAPEEIDSKVKTWFRSTLYTHLADTLENMDVTLCDSERSNLIDDIQHVMNKLRELPMAAALEELIVDLNCLLVLFRAGMEGTSVKAADASEVSEALKTGRFALLRDTLSKSAAGAEYSGALSELLRRGASDDLGDARLKHAADVFADDLMLRFVANTVEPGLDIMTPELMLVNCSLVFNGGG